MNKVYFFALALLAMPTLADNNRGFYVGIGAAGIDDRQDLTLRTNGMTLGDTTAIRTGELISGYKYNDVLVAEIRIGSSVRPGKGFDFTVAPGSAVPKEQIERDIGNYESIYYRPEMVNDEAKLYALLGYTKTSSSLTRKDLQGKAELGKVSTSYSGASYGIGISFVIDEHFNINFEYKNICDGLYNKPNMSSVNIDYRF